MINAALSRFATHENSAYPLLWRGCVGAWCPSLGPSGARLHDYSRRNNWAFFYNMDVTANWAIKDGAYALNMDGVNDEALANIVLYQRTSRVSIACWAHFGSTSLKGALFRIGYTSGTVNDGIAIGVGSTTMDNLGNNIIGGYEGLRWIATGVAYGTGWHHVGLVCDANGYPIIYLDGKQVYSDSLGAPNPIGNAGGFTGIGGYNQPGFGGFPRYFAGHIDDFFAWDRIVTPSEWRLLARRRGIAFTPRSRRLAVPEQAAGGATPWLYARRRSQIIGSGGVH